eukprot:3344320-Prymnesium_polylepis.1
MLRGQGVQRSELWVACAGFANRCERAGAARDTAPDCTDPGVSTMEMHLPTIFAAAWPDKLVRLGRKGALLHN